MSFPIHSLPQELLSLILSYLDSVSILNLCELIPNLHIPKEVYESIFHDHRILTNVTSQQLRERMRAQPLFLSEALFGEYEFDPLDADDVLGDLEWEGQTITSLFFQNNCLNLVTLSHEVLNALWWRSNRSVTKGHTFVETATSQYEAIFVDTEGAAFRPQEFTEWISGESSDRFKFVDEFTNFELEGKVSKPRIQGDCPACYMEDTGILCWKGHSEAVYGIINQHVSVVPRTDKIDDFVITKYGDIVYLQDGKITLVNKWKRSRQPGRFVQIRPGNLEHYIALREDGRVVEKKTSPKPLGFISLDFPPNLVSVAMGRKYCFAITKDGFLYCQKQKTGMSLSSKAHKIPLPGKAFALDAHDNKLAVLVYKSEVSSDKGD